jgi:hypothetical protein
MIQIVVRAFMVNSPFEESLRALRDIGDAFRASAVIYYTSAVTKEANASAKNTLFWVRNGSNTAT